MHSHHTDEGAQSAGPATAQPVDLEAARAALAADEDRRIRECAAEIEEVLARYNMRLDVTPAQITLMPR
ncbi:hypothetical protein [Streptomyces sp. NPDC051636]|uniref:hypothetical protein n=1 Tax=Streptomyces sp. NPDC051636 TaxID=3365663 RepID=UPI0037B8C558